MHLVRWKYLQIMDQNAELNYSLKSEAYLIVIQNFFIPVCLSMFAAQWPTPNAYYAMRAFFRSYPFGYYSVSHPHSIHTALYVASRCAYISLSTHCTQFVENRERERESCRRKWIIRQSCMCVWFSYRVIVKLWQFPIVSVCAMLCVWRCVDWQTVCDKWHR